MRFLGKILFIFTILFVLTAISVLFYYYYSSSSGDGGILVANKRVTFPGDIAFVASKGGKRSIKLVDPNSGNVQSLMMGSGVERYIAVSRQGDKLAYGIARGNEATLYVASLPGGRSIPVTKPANNLMPSFSFDGNNLVYVQDHGGTFRSLLDVNLGRLNTRLFVKPRHWYSDPKFLPDGRIVCTAFLESQDQIVALNPKNGSETNLTSNNYGNTEPAVSHDGKEIVFVSNRDGNPEIYAMDTDGSNVHRFTLTSSIDYQDPAWSPDGKYIVFASNMEGSNYNLYIMDLQGNVVKRVTNADEDESSPAWYIPHVP